MADVWGALAQVIPLAATLTTGYTVPALKHATAKVVICNRGLAASIRISHAVAAAADDPKQYLLYDYGLAVGETKSTEQITVSAGDIIRVYSSTATVAFNINGIEEDN